MPFSPSHAVVALPFARTPLVPAAIAVGAMTPDLPLFLRGTFVSYGWTHDLRWLPATMGLALVLLLVWRCVLRPAVRQLTPRPIAERLPAAWDGGAVRALRETFPSIVGILWLVAALALGVASHILWDLFTHEGRGGVTLLPALDAMWGPLPGYKWLQHGSSALGLAIIALWGLRELVRRPVVPVRPRVPAVVPGVVWLSLPVVLVAAWIAGWLRYGPFDSAFTPAHLAYQVLPPACAVWGLIVLAACIGVQVWAGTRRGTSTAAEPGNRV